MTGFLKPVDPLPAEPHLLSWGHLLPHRKSDAEPTRRSVSGWVGQVAFSPDGNWLAAGTSSGTVHAWRLDRKAEEAQLQAGNLPSIAFSPDSRSLIVGGYQGEAYRFDLPSPKISGFSGKHRGAIASVATLNRSAHVVTGGIDGVIHLWNSDGDHLRELSGHKSWVNAVASFSDETIVSGSSDGTVKLWNVTTGECTRSLDATKAEVRSIAVSRDGKRIAAGIRYGVTQVWDTADWSETVIEQKADDVWSIVFSGDGQQIITAAGEWNRPTDIVFWNIASKKAVKTLRHTGEVMSLALSPDGKQLAAGGMDKAVSVWMLEP